MSVKKVWFAVIITPLFLVNLTPLYPIKPVRSPLKRLKKCLKENAVLKRRIEELEALEKKPKKESQKTKTTPTSRDSIRQLGEKLTSLEKVVKALKKEIVAETLGKKSSRR